MTAEFEDKHVVITGATGGLGGAVVEALLAAGATCHLPIDAPEVPESAAWRGHARARVTPGIDLTDERAVTAYYGSLPAPWASIHLVGGFAMAPATETSLDDLERMLALNVKTCFLCCREATRLMRAHGGGRIVNVGARPAVEPVAGMLAYTVAKAGVTALTRALAAEVTGDGILVNAVLPSIIDTPANRRAMPDADFARWPRPEELAVTINFLSSPRNRLTSGCLLPLYGQA